MLPVAILSGGLATRLRPATETIPKALIDINGEPFIAHQLRLLSGAGAERVILCVGYLGEAIEEFVGDGRRFGLHLTYSWDEPNPCGTAGAVRNALPLLGEEFLVLYGDSYLPCDYRAVEQAFIGSGQPGLMTVFRNRNLWETSNVEFAGGQIAAYDKERPAAAMEHVDYGLSAFHSSVFSAAGDQASDLTAVFQELIGRRRLAGLEVRGRFYEAGSWEGIRTLQAYLIPELGSSAAEHPAVVQNSGLTFVREYLAEVRKIAENLDTGEIEHAVAILANTRQRGGRLFILGVGGSAANASHAVNDFRKITGMEAYAPTDNVAELTARTNDEGWITVFEAWLAGSRLRAEDTLLVLSVGGGNLEKNVSPNLVKALEYARRIGASIVGIVGSDGGFTAQVADACVLIPTVNTLHVTPHAEAFQATIWHLFVSHRALKQVQTKWESTR
jgi:NDP-sugar pyrophosphorylase family protein